MRQPAKVFKHTFGVAARCSEERGGGEGGGGVETVMPRGEGAVVRKVGDGSVPVAQRIRLHPDAAVRHRASGNTHARRTPMTALALNAFGFARGEFVVGADNGAGGVVKDGAFGADVFLQRAVPVDVIGRETDKHGDLGGERRRDGELKRTEFQHIDGLSLRPAFARDIQHGRPQVAARHGVFAVGGEEFGDECRGG